MIASAPDSGTLLASDRFRRARADDWERLEDLLDRIERGRAGSLSDEDLFEMPVLYRATLSSLSAARETSLDTDLVSYLEALSTRAYFVLYGVHAPMHRRVLRFFAADWPAAVRALGRETLVATAMLVIGAVVAYLLVRGDPGWYYSIIPGDLAGGRDPSTAADKLREGLYGSGDLLGIFATFLFTHNAQIALLCFALGFAFGVPTILLLLYNGCMLGAFLAVYVPKGLGFSSAAWLAIHGTTELFAITLAGAAGLHIGMAAAFPGRVSRFASMVAAGRAASQVMFGVVVMLAVAGVLEGVGRQLVTVDAVRATIGATALAGWLLYFYRPARERGATAGG